MSAEGEDKLEGARQEVRAVTGIMRDNMGRLLEREGKLGDLELRADQLQAGSEQFQVCRAVLASFLELIIKHWIILLVNIFLIVLICLDHIVAVDLLIILLTDLCYLTVLYCRRRQ